MKKIVLFIMIVALSTLSFSCRYFSDAAQSTYSKSFSGDDLLISKRYIYDLISAINERNPEKLKQLMSKLDTVVYSEEKIDEIINLFPEKIKDPKYQGNKRNGYSVNYGKYQKYTSDKVILQTENNQYFYMRYGLCYSDDYYEKNEGFTYLDFYDAYGIAYENYLWEVQNPDKENITITKGDLLEGYSEVRKVFDENGSDLLFYKRIDRENTITKQTVEMFLKKDKSYSNFIDYFGEANMKCANFYTAWETENGNYIKVYVSDNIIYQCQYCNETSVLSRFEGLF